MCTEEGRDPIIISLGLVFIHRDYPHCDAGYVRLESFRKLKPERQSGWYKVLSRVAMDEGGPEGHDWWLDTAARIQPRCENMRKPVDSVRQQVRAEKLGKHWTGRILLWAFVGWARVFGLARDLELVATARRWSMQRTLVGRSSPDRRRTEHILRLQTIHVNGLYQTRTNQYNTLIQRYHTNNPWGTDSSKED